MIMVHTSTILFTDLLFISWLNAAFTASVVNSFLHVLFYVLFGSYISYLLKVKVP